MHAVVDYLDRQRKWMLVVLGLTLVVLMGIVDAWSGPILYVSSPILYLFPIFLVTWFAGRRAGISVSVACAVAAASAEFWVGSPFSLPFIPYWNAVARLVLFLAATFIISELRAALDKQRQLAWTDYLTGAVNARYFFELSNVEMDRVRRYRHPFTIFYMDVDNFKTVNDRFGHRTGDSLLRWVAKTLKSHVRASDIVARIGGDEFAVLLPETGYEQAKAVAPRVNSGLLDAMERNQWPATFSIGAATFITAPASVDEMMEKVDALMYAAKQSGKNMIVHGVFGETATDAASATSR
ncbi:MAG: GGDEF domain-containing protein [Chloroflexi bacterium]|nr:GGDEF domain-containing protein [Chloroflexota bacterium]